MTTMLECLKAIKADLSLISNKDAGICNLMMVCEDYSGAVLFELFKTWPEFSGLLTYPIQTDPERKPESLFIFTDNHHMWNHFHPYGAARWRLVDHLIQELSK